MNTAEPLAVQREEKGFIGERRDAETGLIYLHARYYNPALGCFISADWYDPNQPGVGTNRYAYAFNSPATLSDRTGHEGEEGGAGGGGVTVLPGIDVTADAPSSIFVANGLPGTWNSGITPDLFIPGAVYSPGLASITQGNPQTASSGSARASIVHGVLTAASFCPSACGSAFSVVDAGIYAAEGDKIGSGISLGAAAVGVFSDAGAVKVAALGARELGVAANAAPRAYSVAFETVIPRLGLGTRPAHFAAANRALGAAIRAHAEFASMMERLGIMVPSQLGRSPAGWTWHHALDRSDAISPASTASGKRLANAASPWRRGWFRTGFARWGLDY